MATVYATTQDQYNAKAASDTWANVRGDVNSSSDSVRDTVTSYGFAIYTLGSPRGGGTYFVFRTYLPFDLSGENGTVNSTSLYIYSRNRGTSGHPSRLIAVEATAISGVTADYGNLFTSGTTLGTTMTAATTISGSIGYQELVITGDTSTGGIKIINDAIGVAGSGGTVTIALTSYTYDYSNSAPIIGGDYNATELYFADYSGTSRDPYLDISYETVPSADNAVFFGTNF